MRSPIERTVKVVERALQPPAGIGATLDAVEQRQIGEAHAATIVEAVAEVIVREEARPGPTGIDDETGMPYTARGGSPAANSARTSAASRGDTASSASRFRSQSLRHCVSANRFCCPKPGHAL